MLNTSSNKNTKSAEKKTIRGIIISGLAVLVLFVFLGSLRKEDSIDSSDITSLIGGHSGGALYALDVYIQEFGLYGSAKYFGEQTQVLYYSILNFFGFSSLKADVVLPVMYVHNEETNIYTALGRYIHDYGVYWMGVIMSFLGFLFTIMFNHNMKKGGGK